jgi:hypothetical protein
MPRVSLSISVATRLRIGPDGIVRAPAGVRLRRRRHGGPDPCVVARKGRDGASVGVRVGWAMETRNSLCRGADALTTGGRQHCWRRFREPSSGRRGVQEPPCLRGISMCERRPVPRSPARLDGGAGRAEKAKAVSRDGRSWEVRRSRNGCEAGEQVDPAPNGHDRDLHLSGDLCRGQTMIVSHVASAHVRSTRTPGAALGIEKPEKPPLCGAFPTRPRGLEPPRINQSRRPSTRSAPCGCSGQRPNRANCGLLDALDALKGWMSSRVLSRICVLAAAVVAGCLILVIGAPTADSMAEDDPRTRNPAGRGCTRR